MQGSSFPKNDESDARRDHGTNPASWLARAVESDVESSQTIK